MRFAYLTFLPKSTKVKVLLHAAALHLLFLFGIASVIQMPLLASPHHLQPEGTLETMHNVQNRSFCETNGGSKLS